MTVPSRRPIPLKPDFGRERQNRPADHLVRAACVALKWAAIPPAVQAEKKISDIEILRDLFGEDQPTEILLRSATNPATLTGTGWAADVAVAAMADFIAVLAARSAGAALIARGLQVPMDGYSGVQIPSYVTSAADAGAFVAEDGAIPVRAMDFSNGPIFAPRKFAVITAFHEELARGSRFEAVVRQVLSEACALALDSAMFSSTAGDATRPGGLLFGVTPLTAKTGGDIVAVAEDIKTLLDALTTAGGARDPIFVAAPSTAAALKTWVGPRFDYDILQSSALAKNTLVAIEAPAFASTFAPVPEFSASNQAVLHLDTAATAISTGGTIASGGDVRSLWQQRTLALKTVLRCSWGLRASGTRPTTSPSLFPP